MKTSVLLFAASLASSVCANAVLQRGTSCNAGNNCQRGVNGTSGNKPPRSSRLADCSSYMTVTVVPTPVTVLETTTTTTTTTVAAAKRDVTIVGPTTIIPSATPTYATYCDNASAYASACSCAGVTAGTTTLPTQTVTTTVTSTCVVQELMKRAMGGVVGMMEGMGSMGLRRGMEEGQDS